MQEYDFRTKWSEYFPEEIEDALNSTYIQESIVMQQEGNIAALAYFEHEKMDKEQIVLNQYFIQEVNKVLPLYCQISDLFSKTEEF